MPEHAGRPKYNAEDTVAMTLRIDRAYYRELTELAAECGIRSVNNYSIFMLISHVNSVRTAQRNLLDGATQ